MLGAAQDGRTPSSYIKEEALGQCHLNLAYHSLLPLSIPHLLLCVVKALLAELSTKFTTAVALFVVTFIRTFIHLSYNFHDHALYLYM
jgi:hypothetical protein